MSPELLLAIAIKLAIITVLVLIRRHRKCAERTAAAETIDAPATTAGSPGASSPDA